MRNILIFACLSIILLLPVSARAQDDFMMPGQTRPGEAVAPDQPYGWKWRFQMGGHMHLKRDAFWDNRRFPGDSETRSFLSWDLGLVNLDENLDGWGGGVFAWIGGDYEGAWGLKGYRRWALGGEAEPYFQVGPGIILDAGAWEQDYGDIGAVLEAELGIRYIAVSTSVTFLPYTGRGADLVWNGQDYVEVPGEDGLDVAWNMGLKVAGPFAGITTGITAVTAYLALQSLGGLD